MNAEGDVWKRRWDELRGPVHGKWGRLTEDDLVEIAGDRERLLDKLQERYGLAREVASETLAEFELHIGR